MMLFVENGTVTDGRFVTVLVQVCVCISSRHLIKTHFKYSAKWPSICKDGNVSAQFKALRSALVLMKYKCSLPKEGFPFTGRNDY